jgi:hypothetical protein
MKLSENLQHSLELMVDQSARDMVQGDLKYKEMYEDLESMLRQLISDAKELKEDFKENNLTVSMIESEGFLRCGIIVEEYLNNTVYNSEVQP